MEYMNSHLGETIVLLRTALQLRQSELAESAGVSLTYLKGLETNSNRPNLTKLTAVSKVLGVNVGDLLNMADAYAPGPTAVQKIMHAFNR